MSESNIVVLRPDTGDEVVEWCFKNKPRETLEKLLERGCKISAEIDDLTDDDCEKICRLTYIQLKKNEAN
jgi:hypothetical protein